MSSGEIYVTEKLVKLYVDKMVQLSIYDQNLNFISSFWKSLQREMDYLFTKLMNVEILLIKHNESNDIGKRVR